MPNFQSISPRCRNRRVLAMLTAIALPLPLTSCFNNKALLPLQAACEGTGVAEAASYEPDAANPPIVALTREGDKTKVQGKYLGDDVTSATAIADTQLVACINFQNPIVVEKCTYMGAGVSTLNRLGRKAEVKLVAAQTGQVLYSELLLKEPDMCPQSVEFRQGENEKSVSVKIKVFKDTLIAWMPKAIAAADLSGAATDEFLPLGQQCEKLKTAMETDLRWADSSIQYGVIDPAENDSSVRVAASSGLDTTQELLEHVAQASKAINAAPITYDKLLTTKAQFQENLTHSEQHLTRFQELSQEAEPLVTGAIDREQLKPIGDEMKTLAEDISKQSESMTELFQGMFSRCFELQNMNL